MLDNAIYLIWVDDLVQSELLVSLDVLRLGVDEAGHVGVDGLATILLNWQTLAEEEKKSFKC
jgi:hypothetical protein